MHALTLRTFRVAVALAAAPLAGVTLASSTLAAQAAPASSRPTFGISGGIALPLGDFGDGFNSGYDIAAHVGFRPSGQAFGVRAEGAFNRFGAKGGGSADVHANIFGVTGNLIIGTPATPGSVRPYFIGGAGIYNVKAEAKVANSTVSSSDTKFGLNVGAGLDLPLSGIAAFAEARYHIVFTDGGNTAFVPIVVGVRF